MALDSDELPTPGRRTVLKTVGGAGVGAVLGSETAIAQRGDRVEWTFETDDTVGRSPTVVDGTVFTDGYDTNQYAIDAETGDQQWVFRTDKPVFSPLVVDGTLFTSSASDTLYALDAGTGDQQWTVQTSGGPSIVTTVG